MRNLLFVFLSICLLPFLVTSSSSTLNDDVLGLIVFKSDIQGPGDVLKSWNDDTDPCSEWKGVKCNNFSRVSELVLDGFGFVGKLGKGLHKLNFLQKLSLAKNKLTGNLSLDLSQFPNLTALDLSENGLSGLIPSHFFSQCGLLTSISLANNNFSGAIPDSLSSCSALTSLSLSGNQFSGLLPAEIWSMTALESLDLSDNHLAGKIPAGIEGLTNLSTINLRNNQFSGAVPGGIGKCISLKSIDFSRNKFFGEIPSTMQNLSLCRELVLSGNEIYSDIPEWIGNMTSLEMLDLSRNSFSGKIPDSFANLMSLKTLNVFENDLTGNIPFWFFGLGLEHVRISGNGLTGTLDDAFALSTDSRKKLVVLDLSQNNFSGAIPAAVGDFGGMKLLSMARNSFTGSIPENIGLLKKLRVLDLSENQLNGSIPSEIGELASLKSLYLSHNEITGPIPESLANNTDLVNVDFSFNNLNGLLPKRLSYLVNLKSFNISHNQLEGPLPLGGFFNTIDPSSVSYNHLCGAVLNNTCAIDKFLPKPIVLDPNSTDPTNPNAINSPSFHRGKRVLSISSLIAICAAIAIVVGVIFVTVLNLHVRYSSGSRSVRSIAFSGEPYNDDLSRSSPSSDGGSGKLVMFSGDNPDFSYIGAHALLDKDRELGRGGFGPIYRAVFGDGRTAAIKKLAVSSLVKSQEDFEREVEKLGKVRDHTNLVALDGYYWTPSLQLLIYEFVPGGNLYKHLHESRPMENNLSWNERFNIILGTAKGLANLHQENIIHYNLKSSNVMIDSSGEPKVADYGLARLLPVLDRYVLSSKIQSALGYMAPEFGCKTVKITDKCDVYGFGALVLEIVTGKRPVEYTEDDVVVLCDMIKGALEEGVVEECVDGRLQGEFPVEEAIPVMKLGLICTSQVPSNRPDMAEVVNILELIRCPDELGDFSIELN